MDQRGALRSDALDGEAPFGLGDLLADIEALREQLGIERWSALGYSFGGHLGVRYALEHPTSVAFLILETRERRVAPPQTRASSSCAGGGSCCRAAPQAPRTPDDWRLHIAREGRENQP